MSDSMLVSVIIPAYNAGEYLAQCIENLLAQTHKNLEIIVVDDGSTDNTAQVARQYPSVRYLYQENEGPSSARNRGIEAASGEYIHFMDADDAITLDFHEKMVQAMVNTDAEIAFCGFFFERFPKQTQRVQYHAIYTKTEDKIKATNVCNYGACWRYLFNLSFLKEQNLRFELGRLAEDRMFSLQAVFFAKRIVSVPDIMYIYKNRVNALTTDKGVKKIKKRREDRKHADRFQASFAGEHGFTLDRSLHYRHWQFKLLGIPLVTKRVYHPGKIRWYFLNIPIFQKKEIDVW